MIVVATEYEKAKIEEKYGKRNILVTGVGGTNVFKALCKISIDEPIINIGYAGSNDIPIGTIVSISQSGLHHENTAYLEPICKLPGKVKCYTSNDFVTKSNLFGCVFDMELAFICAMGFKHIRSYKYVSDNLNYNQFDNTLNEYK